MMGVAASVITIILVGGITVGTPSNERLPEVSPVSGYEWTVQSDVVAASIWARRNVGTGRRFATDEVDAPALASYGDEAPVSEEDAWPIFFAKTMDPSVVQTIKRARIAFLLVNQRMTRGVPPTPGYYFSPLEPQAGTRTRPLAPDLLAKFGSASCTSLVYNSGPIKIYDVSAIGNGTCRL
jgi:hypothetical protein